jgi:hypothetical protein
MAVASALIVPNFGTTPGCAGRCQHRGMADGVVEDPELRDELLRRAEVDQRARRACTPLFAKARDGMVHPDDLTVDERAIVDGRVAIKLLSSSVHALN